MEVLSITTVCFLDHFAKKEKGKEELIWWNYASFRCQIDQKHKCCPAYKFAINLRIFQRGNIVFGSRLWFSVHFYELLWSLMFYFPIWWGHDYFYAILSTSRKKHEYIFRLDQMDKKSLFMMNRCHLSKGWMAALLILFLSLLTFLWGFQPEMGKRLESTHEIIKEMEVGLPFPVAYMQLLC